MALHGSFHRASAQHRNVLRKGLTTEGRWSHWSWNNRAFTCSGSSFGWRQLDVAVVGGGIGGMSAATALRRAGHKVSIYERTNFIGQAGASISCAANGTRWLHEWGVDVAQGDGVILRKLISRDWTTGKILTEYELEDYEKRWGYVYYMFQRQSMHKMLENAALGEGAGVPVQLFLSHKVTGHVLHAHLRDSVQATASLTLSISARISTSRLVRLSLRMDLWSIMISLSARMALGLPFVVFSVSGRRGDLLSLAACMQTSLLKMPSPLVCRISRKMMPCSSGAAMARAGTR